MSNDDQRSLREFCAARDRGDAAAMQRWWARLVESNADRVTSMAAAMGSFKLTRSEREDAAQLALIKVWKNMIHTFRGDSVGAFYAALVQCVRYALLQVQREGAIQLDRTRSFDDGGGDDNAVDGYALLGGELSEERFERELEKREATDFVQWALTAMTHANHRTVIERTLEGVPVPEIAAALDTTENNIHAMRSRGLKELRKLWNDYEDRDA